MTCLPVHKGSLLLVRVDTRQKRTQQAVSEASSLSKQEPVGGAPGKIYLWGSLAVNYGARGRSLPIFLSRCLGWHK